MNILFTNDWHFAKTNPTSRIDDYNEELLGLLNQLAILARYFKCEAVCHAGDIFHTKGNAPWEIVRRLLEWGRQLPCPILTITGNHDLFYDRFESIGKTPYGVLTSSGVFEDISRRLYSIGGVGFYGVPWPDGSKPDAFKQVPAGVDVVLAHGYATQEGVERWGTYCHKYETLALQQPGVRVWHFGHDHTDHGVFTLQNGAQVINVGALARGALDQDTIIRQVKAVICDVQPGVPLRPQVFALKQKPAEEIFDLARHKERVAEQQHLESFLDQLQQGLSGVLDVDFRQVLDGMPLDTAVRERVAQYIRQAEAAG